MAIFFSNWLLLLKVKNSWDIYINEVWFIKFFENFIKINWADVFDIGIVDFLSRFQYMYTIVSSWNSGRVLPIPMLLL